MNTQQQLTERPPIVVVLGHVDHGKSTLLDSIRKSNTVAGEAGGITQHVAAYEVIHTTSEGEKKRVTFIDTPGHAAFTTIRDRGAQIADVAILVVAADDGVKPQTLEALQSIRGSGIPYIVAINKIDKANADIERAKLSLLEAGVYLEGLGGDVPWVPISAKVGTGISELLDLVLLAVALQEFKADPQVPAQGYVVEANRDPKRGIAATLIINNGTLETGMAVSVGSAFAPLRHIEDHTGTLIDTASFSTPVRVFGFNHLPTVGAAFTTHANRKDAEHAAQIAAEAERKTAENTTEDTGVFMLPVIVKTDFAGSLEAVRKEFAKIGDEHARVKIIHEDIGTITENDMKIAIAALKESPVVVGFTVEADSLAHEIARQHSIHIETSDIIYRLTERLAQILEERRPKRKEEEVLGSARVLKVFSSRHDTYLIGGTVEAGVLAKGSLIKVFRKKELVDEGEVLSLQVARQDAASVATSQEFGASIECPSEVMPGDRLESFTIHTV